MPVLSCNTDETVMITAAVVIVTRLLEEFGGTEALLLLQLFAIASSKYCGECCSMAMPIVRQYVANFFDWVQRSWGAPMGLYNACKRDVAALFRGPSEAYYDF
jgi:hypothetical protein